MAAPQRLGVDLFLTLSGFLITSLLLEERDRTGRIDLAAFLSRRARRLVPALTAILAVALAIAVTDRWYSEQGIYAAGDVITTAAWSLSFTANWAILLDWGLQPLGHIWTLGLEGQFYVLWGTTLVLASRVRRMYPAVMALALLTIAVVVHHRWSGYTDDPAAMWDYYVGTFSRLDAPLVGALGALWLASGSAHRLGAAVWELGAVVGIASVLLAAFLVPTLDPPLFRWGFTLVAVGATVAVVGVVRADGRRIGRALRVRPLVFLGLVSYSLYLWHLPVFFLLRQHAPGWPQPAGAAVGLLVALGLACLSYRFVERPFLRRRTVVTVRTSAAPEIVTGA